MSAFGVNRASLLERASHGGRRRDDAVKCLHFWGWLRRTDLDAIGSVRYADSAVPQ
jgi:hypothetical protein